MLESNRYDRRHQALYTLEINSDNASRPKARNHLRRQGMERLPAILQANRDRLRPILMTTLTLVAGMLPLALGTGPGAEERRAVAVVVIGGQALCLLLTLLVTPVVYSLLDDLGERLHWRRLVARTAFGRDLPPGPESLPTPDTVQ